jgi:hypothetical protein
MLKINRYILILIILIITIIFSYISQKKIIDKICPDIIVSPSGYYGFYTLGICNYIKNNYNIENKNIIGFSSGSFNGLYLSVCKKKEKKLLKLLLKMGNYKNLKEISEKFKRKITKNFKLNDFNNKLNIALTHINKLGIYNSFNTIEELIDCCYGSSFIPYITLKKIIYYYNKKITFDGGLYYKLFKIKKEKNNKILIINPQLFGRYKKMYPVKLLIRPKQGPYNLFLLGYLDAKNNKTLLDKYLL